MDPPITECVNRLIAKPPQNKRDAVIVFSYFSTRLGEIGSNNIAKLQTSHIVPSAARGSSRNGSIDSKSLAQSNVKHLTPQQCYLGSSPQYGEIFDFVDFGVEANSFLQKCGCKNEPTTTELATLACREPARLFTTLVSPERYIAMLKTFAEESTTLKRDKDLYKQMKSARWLLGSMEVATGKNARDSKHGVLDGNGSDDDMEDLSIKTWKLVTPGEVVVVRILSTCSPFP